MAMATILTIPPVLVYFFTQRYFIQGIVISGVKG
jgi:ABC-type glycerol-3-phosphate transport system permease component